MRRLGMAVAAVLLCAHCYICSNEKIKGKKKRGKWPLCLGLTI